MYKLTKTFNIYFNCLNHLYEIILKFLGFSTASMLSSVAHNAMVVFVAKWNKATATNGALCFGSTWNVCL